MNKWPYVKFSRVLLLALCQAALWQSTLVLAEDGLPEWRYTIRPGDTLISFSQRYLSRPADWVRLQKINRVTDPYHLLPGQSLHVPLAMLRQALAPAELISVSGSVKIKQANMPERVARVGEKLMSGTELLTAADSSAALRFADGSVLVLQPTSQIKLDVMSVYAGGGMVDTKLRMQEGRAEVVANPKHKSGNRLQVITPSAVAAVRGTRFRVAADGNVIREETLEGRVAFSAAGKSVMLAGGYGSVAEKGMPPSAPVALLAAPDVKNLATKIERLPMRFELAEQAGAKRWVGQIAADVQFNHILLERASENPRLIFADLPDGKYVLRVRAQDAIGLIGMDAQHSFELDARPFAPLLLSPVAEALVRNARPAFKWSEVIGEGAAKNIYHLELARDAAFKEVLIVQTTVQTDWQPTQDLLAGDYFWRVASVDGSDQGPYTDAVKFTYKPAPAAPDLTQSALTFVGKQMQIQLPKPSEGLHYEVDLTADQAREQLIWHGDSLDGKLLLPRPEAGKRYLSVRLVESDNTAGPYATQVLDIPKPVVPMMLQLLPLATS